MNDTQKILNILTALQKDIADIKMGNITIGGFTSRKHIMRFFDLCDTSMNTLENTGQLKVSKIGRRKFYDINSIKELLNKNITGK